MIADTPEHAAAAFYRAFERRDLDDMMAVWSTAPDTVCIHPMGHRLDGYDAIRETWKQIFGNAPAMHFHNTRERFIVNRDIAIQTLQEIIYVEGQTGSPSGVLATNIFRCEAGEWRMIMHHASPRPESASSKSVPAERRIH